jgi:hypothetical protein
MTPLPHIGFGMQDEVSNLQEEVHLRVPPFCPRESQVILPKLLPSHSSLESRMLLPQLVKGEIGEHLFRLILQAEHSTVPEVKLLGEYELQDEGTTPRLSPSHDSPCSMMPLPQTGVFAVQGEVSTWQFGKHCKLGPFMPTSEHLVRLPILCGLAAVLLE